MGRVKHLGFIPDGGGRWAVHEGVSLAEGYRRSMTKILEIALDFFAGGGSEMSVYLFSVDNFRRQEWEVDALMEVATEFLGDIRRRHGSLGFCPVHVGNFNLLRADVQQAVRDLPNSGRKGGVMNLLIGYDPWDELRAAMQISARTGQEIRDCLAVSNAVDLVIRTGGAKTLSKFLPLQSAHARLVFLDVLFNDLRAAEVMEIIQEHESMDLRYGN